MTKTIVYSARDRLVAEKRVYLARFIGFFFGFGVCGSGGEFNMFRSNSSLRRNASSRGRNSIELSSIAAPSRFFWAGVIEDFQYE